MTVEASGRRDCLATALVLAQSRKAQSVVLSSFRKDCRTSLFVLHYSQMTVIPTWVWAGSGSG